MATGSSKAASPNTELGGKDLAELVEVLHPARNKYFHFGLQIGLENDEIESVENRYQNAGDRLRAILSVRLNKANSLTWNEIDSALRSKSVDKSSLAEEIRRKYGHLFISAGEEEHEIKSKEILQVKKSAPKRRKGDNHGAKVRERSPEYDGTETVRSVQEVEREDEEDGVLSRKEKKEKLRRKGAHYQYKEVHGRERPKGKNKKGRFMKDESQSEPEEVVREKSKRKNKATHGESAIGYGDQDHFSDTEVCEKVRKRSKKHSKKREVYTESESEASCDEDEMESSSFEDHTSHKESAERKLTKHKEHPQKEHRKGGKKKDAKSRDIQYSDEEVSTKSAQILRKKVETESEEESSFASSSDEEEIAVHKSNKMSKYAETKSAARTKDTSHYEKGRKESH